ncbi:PAQR6 protein, partial [Hemiprocne comata]|nr:PAQR6 protein [Hemiprocne comata]
MLTIKLPQIFRVHQVPRIFWEDGIMSGYRHPKSSALDCVLSSFQMTNETVNIWTHFLPTWYFVWRFLVLWSSLDLCWEPFHWPLLIYLLLVCLYPFASSCAHTFSSMSARARHICYFCDYGALSLYSLGETLQDRGGDKDHGILESLRLEKTSKVTKSSCQPNTAMNIHHIPNCHIHSLLFCFWSNGAWSEAVAGYCYHLLFALLTAFLFTSHLPERLAPGRFDYIAGHSHQLFHISAVLGTHFQLEAVLCDVGSRRAWLRGRSPPTGLPGTFGTAGLALLGNVAIIGAFTAALSRAP